MLEMIGERILELLGGGNIKPEEIVLLSSYADPVTEYVVGRVIERGGYHIKNLTRKSRVIDNPFAQALITLAQLCHSEYKISPNRDDVKSLIRMILKIDPIRSSILAGEICKQKPHASFPELTDAKLIDRVGYYNKEKYEYIKNWIDNYRNGKYLPINEFFQKVFLEILISKDISPKDILEARNLIDSAGNFYEVVSKFKRNANKDFLDMIRRGIKSSESIFELEEKLNGDYLILSTPSAFLASSLTTKVLIISGLSSKNWTPRSMKELTNNHVLTKTWNDGMIYTEDMEEKNQKEYAALIFRQIIKRCKERLITFESNISSNGFENDGILSTCIDSILK